jgi:hypothetical protein
VDVALIMAARLSGFLQLLQASVALHFGRSPTLLGSGTSVALRLSRSPLASAPLECETVEGQALARLLAEAADGAEAQRAWELGLSEVLERFSSAPLPEVNGTSLAARVAQLRQLTSARQYVADCLRLRVAQALRAEGLELIPALSDIAPAAALPSAATTLDAARRAMPTEASRQLETFLEASAPSDDPRLSGRFDRLQGAQLYMGHVQFGYFLAQVFRGTAHLAENQVVSVPVARRVKEEIETATRRTKTDAAWAVASVRAGVYFELDDPGAPPSGDAGGGSVGADGSRGVTVSRYEELREFTTGVQVIRPAVVDEFFDTGGEGHPPAEPARDGTENQPAAEPGAGGVAEATATLPPPLPRASFVRFNAAGLQALCCEACLVGYTLWGVEREALTLLGEEASRELMPPPPARGGSEAGRAEG